MSAETKKRPASKKRSGNPARRQQQEIRDLWPFALDYYMQSSRVGLYEPITVHADGESRYIDLPNLGRIAVDGDLVAPAQVGVIVVAAPAGDWAAVLCHGDDQGGRTQSMLDGLTEAFVNELGSQAAAKYARAAAQSRPALTNRAEAMKIVDYLLGRQEPGQKIAT